MIIYTTDGPVELTEQQMRDVWIEYEHVRAIDLVKAFIENWCFDNDIPNSRRYELLANESLIRNIAEDYEDRLENNRLYDDEWEEELEDVAMGYLDFDEEGIEND